MRARLALVGVLHPDSADIAIYHHLFVLGLRNRESIGDYA